MTEKTLYLAGGCFWGVEAYYQKLDGILETEVGYANGNEYAAPTYREVCAGVTGFAETVRVDYDADVISLNEILAHYFRIVNPTTRDRQGNDIGDQYRPGIYYVDEEDFEPICDYVDMRRRDYKKPIVVEIKPLDNFYTAEEYHQKYLDNTPGGYCHVDLSLASEPLTEKELPTEEEAFVGGAEVGVDAVHPNTKLPDKPSTERTYTRPDDDTLRARLSDEAWHVTQENGTERPFANEYDEHFEPGIYVDIVSGEPLFSSADKFNSGCGWPAFSKPITGQSVRYLEDNSLWRKRIEVRSEQTNSHLGHVFNDGPAELGGMRYCINSASLRFIPLEDMEAEGYGDLIPLVEKPE